MIKNYIFSGLRAKAFFCLLLSALGLGVSAQTLPIGGQMRGIEDLMRRKQLLGMDSSRTSYMLRPLQLDNIIFTSDSIGDGVSRSTLRKELFLSSNGQIAAYLLPVSWVNQYNTSHPFGSNDGSMIPSRGFQTQLSTGVFAKLGPLSIQLRPEFVYAQNRDYRTLSESGRSYNGFYNRIDLPERYGNGSYTKVNWGQSSIRLTFDPISFGLSNENIWWGPGIHNSLLMSDNAAGFKHLTLNTSRPAKTPIGSFEGQLIAGRLDPSGYELRGSAYRAKSQNWRYLNAIMLTYQPKWVPNLYLGVDRSFYVYREDMERSFKGYFPIFSATLKKGITVVNETETIIEEGINQDQYISAYARWVLPESKAEIYFQFGRNDFSYNLRDLMLEPESSRAYTAGFRKLVSLPKKDTYLQIGVELTQMQGSNTYPVRAQPNWYLHYVAAGYTNKGEIIGAAVGPEGNQQTFELSWVRGLKKIGLRFDHLNHNVELANVSDGEKEYWRDFIFGGQYDWNYKKFIFNSQLNYIYSRNYQYLNEMTNNFSLRLSAIYSF